MIIKKQVKKQNPILEAVLNKSDIIHIRKPDTDEQTEMELSKQAAIQEEERKQNEARNLAEQQNKSKLERLNGVLETKKANVNNIQSKIDPLLAKIADIKTDIKKLENDALFDLEFILQFEPDFKATSSIVPSAPKTSSGTGKSGRDMVKTGNAYKVLELLAKGENEGGLEPSAIAGKLAVQTKDLASVFQSLKMASKIIKTGDCYHITDKGRTYVS